MAEEIVIRDKETGQLYRGSGEVPEGYERVGPAAGLTAEAKPKSAPTSLTMEDVGRGLLRSGLGQQPGGGAYETMTRPGFFSELATKGALPLATSQAGRIAGSRFGMPGQVIGESAGSLLGTAGNQLIGLEPFSPEQLMLSAALPAGMRALAGTGRQAVATGARFLPGSSVARNEIATGQMRAVPGLVGTGESSASAYARAAGVQAPVMMQRTLDAIEKVKKLNQLLPPGLERLEVDKVAAGLEQAAGQSRTLNVDAFWETTKALRQKIDEMAATKAMSTGQLKQIRSAMLKDLEEAATAPGLAGDAAAAIRAGNKLFQKEVASDALKDAIETIGLSTVGTGATVAVRVNPVKMLQWLRKDPEDIVRLLDSAEKKAIEETLTKIAKYAPAMPPPVGVQHGAGPTLIAAAKGGLIGAGFGYSVGGPHGAQIGAQWVAPLAVAGQQLVSRALMTDRGRSLLVAAMGKGDLLDYPKLAALAIALRNPLLGPEDVPRIVPGSEGVPPRPSRRELLGTLGPPTPMR